MLRLKENDYFGERALLESKPRAANVIATSPTKVMFISKAAFEEVLGSLANIIDEDRMRRESISNAVQSAPSSLRDVHLNGTIVVDSLGPLILGQFGGNGKANEPNMTVRSFLLKNVAALNLGQVDPGA